MVAIFQQTSVFVLIWLMHVAWIGLLIGMVSLIGNRLLRNATASINYGWCLFCCLLLVIAIPVAGSISYLSTPRIDVSTSYEVAVAYGESSGLPESTPLEIEQMPAEYEQAVSTRSEPLDNSVSTRDQSDSYSQDLGNRITNASSILPESAGTHRGLTRPGNDGSTVTSSESTGSRLPFFAKWIVLVYVLGFCAMLVRLFFAAWGVRRLIASTSPADESVLQMAREASRRIGLKVSPAVALCERVAVPAVVGLFRPMILIPHSIAAQLPVQQMYAILAHEIAHIRRFDHVVVVGQRLIESVLFFHPVVWLLNRRLDRQRELCCDDLVVACGISRVEYARSLFYVAQSNHDRKTDSHVMAVSAAGTSQSYLLSRIRRLLGDATAVPLKGSSHINLSVTSVVLFALIAVITFSMVLSQWTSSPTPAPAPENAVLASESDVPPEFETYPEIRGFVRDEQGNPIGNATVVVQEHPFKFPGTRSESGESRQREDLAILAQVESSMNGEFAFTDIKVPDFQSYLDSSYPISLVVFHEEHAIAWKHLDFISKKPIEFSLRPSKPVSIQLMSWEGGNTTDVEAQLVGLMNIKNWSAAGQYRDAPSNHIHDGLVYRPFQTAISGLVETQESGFRIIQLPADTIAVVEATAKHQLPQTIYLSNFSSELLEELPKNGGAQILRSPAVQQMQQAAAVKLTILDKATGLPVQGAKYAGGSKQSLVTDAEGRLEIDGLDPSKQFFLRIHPPTGTELLGHSKRIDFTTEPLNQDLTIELETGISLAGKVVDRETGEGISAVHVSFGATVPANSGAIASTGKTNSVGEYEIVVPPTRGTVSIASQVKNYEAWVTENQRMRMISVGVDPTDTENPIAPLKLARIGSWSNVDTAVQFIGSDGKPVSRAKVRVMHFRDQSSHGGLATQRTDSEGMIRVDIANTLQNHRTMVLIAIDEKGSQAATFEIARPETANDRTSIEEYVDELTESRLVDGSSSRVLTVNMQPVETISGTVIDSDSEKPVPFAVVHFHQQAATEYKVWNQYFPPAETDQDGVYELKAISGVKGFTRVHHPDYVLRNSYVDFDYRTPGLDEADGVHRIVSKATTQDSRIQPFIAPAIGGLTGKEAYELLSERFVSDQQSFRRQINDVADPVKLQALLQRRCPYSAYVDRMMEVADANPGTLVEVKALAWACQVPMHTDEKDLAARYRLRTKIGDRLMAEFVDSPEIESCLTSLIYSQPNPRATAEQILETNQDKSIQGNALLLIGKILLNEVGKSARPQTAEWRSDMTDEQLESEAHKVFTRIKNQYSDVPYWRHDNLGTIAEMQLFELDHLGIGDLVEDIQAMDLEGLPMTLSEFRGKFVVLDFWGSWCGPCIGELPTLNQVSEDLANDVVVAGVMNDTLEDAHKAIDEHNVTWRNWREAPGNMPIQTRWNIDRWPTTYLIGRDGRIISKQLRGDRLLERLRELIRAEQETAEASEQTNRDQSAHQANENVINRRMVVSIVDPEGWPFPNAEVTVWSRPQARAEADLACVKAQALMSDEEGKVTIDSIDFSKTDCCIVAKSNNDHAGYVEVFGQSFYGKTPLEIRLSKMEQLEGVVLDYGTGDPIEDCMIRVTFATQRGMKITSTVQVLSDASGKFTLVGLIPDMYTRMHLTCDGYHIFGRFSEDVGLRISNGVDRPFQIELLKESSYQRAIAGARLTLPETQGMEPGSAFQLLVKHYDRAKLRLESRRVGGLDNRVDNFLYEMRTLPHQLYREAIRDLTRRPISSGDEDIRFEALIWLLQNYHSGNEQFTSESEQIVLELAEQHSMHESIDKALSAIRQHHPDPGGVLERIATEHTDPHVRGRAALTMVRLLSPNGYTLSEPASIENLEQRQSREREFLNLIVEKYEAVPENRNSTTTLGERARKMLGWLDQYGIGGKAPTLFGKTLGGADISLEDFSGKYVLIHFWDSRRPSEFETIREIRKTHTDTIQLVSVAYGDQEKAQQAVGKQELDWPILWDSFKGMEYNRGVVAQNLNLGLRWGDAYLNDFKHYRLFVVDPNGKIIAVGLQGDQLSSFIESLNVSQ